jgi:DNA-binding winged helix-turn-helix (wHTH) protein/Tfp pilus assembly protein PilF
MQPKSDSGTVLRFGVFEADLRNSELYKSGRKVYLQELPFRVLVILLERVGTIVTTDELRERIWPGGTFVDYEHGIRTAINKIRAALGDLSENPRFVETVPRRGYRFITPVVRGGPQALASAPPASPSDQAYLKGRYALRRSAGGLVAGVQHFRDSIAMDPSQPQPFLGLALVYLQMGFGYGPLTPAESFAEARTAALQALRLDASLAEAIACLAWIRSFGEWQWQAADREFRSALQLNAASSEVHRLYSWHLSAMRRFEEAVSHAVQARDLDPTSMQSAYSVVAAYWWSRQYDLLADEAERLVQVDPTFPGAPRLLGGVLIQRGKHAEAVAALERANVLSGNEVSTWGLAHLAYGYAVAGHEPEALQLLARLERRATGGYVSPHLFAIVHAGLGNHTTALEFLERAFAGKEAMLAFLQVDYFFDPLRPNPDFQDLIRRMNFPG